MPGYIKNAYQQLNHPPPKPKQYSPFKYTPFTFPKKGQQQLATVHTPTLLLDKKDTTWIQSGVGSLLFWARAIDYTLLPFLNIIGTQQSKPTVQTKEQTKGLLDYAYI